MPRGEYPKPDGWKGGSDDFGFLRTLDGHRGTNPNIPDPGNEADEDFRRNVHHGYGDDEFDADLDD